MKHFLTLLSHETRMLLVSPATYVAATLFLGFLWIGFDSEKRGLQDWIAGTYVIRV